jgi:hypothetical protein
MYDLDKKYLERLEALAAEIQESEELSTYLDTEEEEDYARLKEMFEPRIALVYNEVAANDPLQLIAFETVLLDDAFEGLFLPRLLGYSVLRGDINNKVKYTLPQDHFKAVLLTICESANFDILRKRIGQSIQIGFAMSSDIWITNLINSITNKRIRYFLQSQKLEKYRDPRDRMTGHTRFKRQFKNENYQTSTFPETRSQLSTHFQGLYNFLLYRINSKFDNSTLMPSLKQFVENKELQNMKEYVKIVLLYASYFELDDDQQIHVSEIFNEVRQATPEFNDHYFDFILSIQKDNNQDLTPEADQNMSLIIDKTIKDDLTDYYVLVDTIHDKGYINEDVHEAVKVFYNKNEGLSTINECVRMVIFNYFQRFINNLGVMHYSDYFEITKQFPIYMGIFANQQFNQDLKDVSMSYIRKLLKRFTDKRGKDYQDVKKFVSTTFVDFGFLKEKEVVELFKTRRKRKKAE